MEDSASAGCRIPGAAPEESELTASLSKLARVEPSPLLVKASSSHGGRAETAGGNDQQGQASRARVYRSAGLGRNAQKGVAGQTDDARMMG